jgi:hypothetical protein
MEEIVVLFGPRPLEKRHEEALKELDNRVMYDFVSAIDENHATLWKLKLSVGHAIASWSVWKQDAIVNALQGATQQELLHIAAQFGVRIKDQRTMLHEMFNISERIITAGEESGHE